MDRLHNTLPQDVRPFGYPKTSSQPFLTSFPIKSVVPNYSTPPDVVFRPPTTILRAGPTPTIERLLITPHLHLPYHPENPPVRGCAKCHNRIYAGLGGLLGGGRGQGETPAGPMSPRGSFTFFSIRKVLTDTTTIRRHPTSIPWIAPQQPAPTRQTLRLSKTSSQLLCASLPTHHSFRPLTPAKHSFSGPKRPS